MNPMRQIRIEKVTLNIGAGKSTDKLEKGVKLLQMLTDTKPVKTITNKRIAGWGLRPGLPIGCKVTIRGDEANTIAKRMLGALDRKLNSRKFDNAGNISFGITEYIDIPEAKYDPEIGTAGLQVCITLVRPGFRIKRRKLNNRRIGHKHKITKEDAMEFMKSQFNVAYEEE